MVVNGCPIDISLDTFLEGLQAALTIHPIPLRSYASNKPQLEDIRQAHKFCAAIPWGLVRRLQPCQVADTLHASWQAATMLLVVSD